MGFIRNKAGLGNGTIVDFHIGSAYDVVRAVYDALSYLEPLGQAVLAGELDRVLEDTDIDTLAKLNAIVQDATLGDSGDFATAAQGILADSAIQPADIDSKAELDALIGEALATEAYVLAAVSSLFEYKGTYNAATNTPDLDTAPSGVSKADVYIVDVAGTFFSTPLEVGDMLVAEVDNASVEADWSIINRNIDSDAFATAAQGAKADSATQPGDNISTLTNDSGFTDDQTGAEIKAAYEAEADTNAFTDAEKTKLGTIETNAKDDQTATEIRDAYNSLVPAASQAEMEAGTETAIRRMTPQRVAQAIAALGGGGGGGGMTAVDKDTNYTASADELVYAAAGITVTLPATPNSGDKVFVWDKSDNAGTNAITIGRNGSTIMGVADDAAINMNGGRMDLYYNGTTWLYSYVVQTIQPSNTIAKPVVERLYPQDMEEVSSMVPTLVTANAAGTGGHRIAWLYAGSSVKATDAAIVLPDNWDGGIIRVRAHFSMTGTNGSDMQWIWLMKGRGNGDDMSAGTHFTAYDTVSVSAGVAYQEISPWKTLSYTWATYGIAAGNHLYIRLQRNSDSNSDGAELHFYEVEYTVNETFTAVVNNNPNVLYNEQTGTSYTILASDAGKEIVFTSGSAVAVTLPDGLPQNFQCILSQEGAGTVTVTPSGSDTLNGAGTGIATAAQYSALHLGKRTATNWLVKGA